MAYEGIPGGSTFALNRTRLERMFAELYETSVPITEAVEKTVAADGDPAGVKDFDNLHDALKWAELQTYTKGGEVILSLEDGNHIIGGEGRLDDYNWAYYVFTRASVVLVGASGDKSLCTITLDGWDDGDQWACMFILRSAAILFENVTVDLGADLYPYPENVSLVWGYDSSNFTCTTSTLEDFAGLWFDSGCTVNLFGSVIDGGAGYFEIMGNGTNGYALSSTFQNFTTTAIAVGNGATMCLDGTTTFTGNGSDTNIPLNEIQPDGSYITNKTVPLIQADTVGTTAERPTARQIGHPYFDTTLGYSINWDGTNWVDGAGTTV